jgi:hypothetical protein
MKRMALLLVVGALMACGGDSTGPSQKFSGTWVGNAIVDADDTLHFVFISSETSGAVTGTGTVANTGASEAITFSGTSTPPTVSLSVLVESETLTYTGTFVHSDSLVGVISEGGTSVELDLKKQ